MCVYIMYAHIIHIILLNNFLTNFARDVWWPLVVLVPFEKFSSLFSLPSYAHKYLLVEYSNDSF